MYLGLQNTFCTVVDALRCTVTFCLLSPLPSPIKICCTIAIFLFDRPAKHLPSSVQMSNRQQNKIANKKTLYSSQYDQLQLPATTLFAYLNCGALLSQYLPAMYSLSSGAPVRPGLVSPEIGPNICGARTRVLGVSTRYPSAASQKSTSPLMHLPSRPVPSALVTRVLCTSDELQAG